MSNTSNDNKNTYDSNNESSDSDNESSDSENTDIWNIEGYFGSTICCRNIFNGSLIEIYLSKYEGLCPSGWTYASWGIMKCERVLAFSSKLEYVPISGPARIELKISTYDVDDSDKYKCTWFEYDRNGTGDEWYPRGYIKINHENFKKI
jgi:hypothetical protein